MSASGPSHRRSGPGRSRPPGRLAACAVIVVGAGLALGLTVPQEVKATAGYRSTGSEVLANQSDQQALCLYRLIRQDVPKGARVYVNSSNSAHIQRLSEVSVGWAVPVTTAAQAQFKIDIVPGGCYKVGLWVRPVQVGHS